MDAFQKLFQKTSSSKIVWLDNRTSWSVKNFVGKVYPRKGHESLLRIKKSDSNKIFRESVQNRSEIRGDILVYFYFYCGSGFGNYDMSQF